MDKKFPKNMRQYFETHGFINTGLGAGSHTVYTYEGENATQPIRVTLPNSIAYWKQQNYKSGYLRKLRNAGANEKMISDLRRIPLGLEEDEAIDIRELENSLYNALNARDVVTVSKLLLKISQTLNPTQLKDYSCPPLTRFIDETDEAKIKWAIHREIEELLVRLFKCAFNEHISAVGYANISCRRFHEYEYPTFSDEIANKFGLNITGVDLDHPGAEFDVKGVFVGKLAALFALFDGADEFEISLSNDSGEDDEMLDDASGFYSFTLTMRKVTLEQVKSIKHELEKHISFLVLSGYKL